MEEKFEKVVENMDEFIKEQEEFNLLMAQALGSIIILLDAIRQNDYEVSELERKVDREIASETAKATVDVVTNYLVKRMKVAYAEHRTIQNLCSAIAVLRGNRYGHKHDNF